MDNGAAGGHGICGGPGGGGDNEAVGAKAGDMFAVDTHPEVDNSGKDGFPDHDIIKDMIRFGLTRLTVDGRFEEGPVLDGEPFFGEGLKDGGDFVHGNFGEEAEASEVNAEDGDGTIGDQADAFEEGSIAAEHDHELDGMRQLGFGEDIDGPVEGGGQELADIGCDDGGPAPLMDVVDDAAGGSGCLSVVGFNEETHPSDGFRFENFCDVVFHDQTSELF